MSDLRTIPVHAAEPAQNGEMLSRVKQLRLDNQLSGAKSGGGGGATWLPWILCVVLAVTWAGVAIRSYKNGPQSDGVLATSPANGTNTTGTTSTSSTSTAVESGSIQLEVKGYLVPRQTVAVSPIDVAGQLIKLDIKEGELYQKDQILAEIDPRSYQYTYNESKSSLLAAQERYKAAMQKRDELMPQSVRQIEKDQLIAQINEAKAQKARTDDELQRLQGIRGNVSGKEMDQALNDALANKFRLEKLSIDLRILEQGPRPERIASANADVAGAEADVKSSEARASAAKWRLDNCTIRAPITGTVLAKKSEEGNLVNPLAFAGGSGSVCDMADLSDLEADLEIPEREIAKLKAGQPCRIKADAYPDRTYSGKLDRIMPIANRAKSIVNVRVKVSLPAGEKPGTYLKPEMGAVVSFLPMTSPEAK